MHHARSLTKDVGRERPGRVARALLGGTFLLAALCLAVPARAADDIAGAEGDTVPATRYDAATWTLRATGAAAIRRDDPNAIPQAYAEAERRARLDAVAALTAYVYGIETSSGTIGYRVEQDMDRKSLVDAYVQGATLLEKRYLAGDRLEVDVELNLKGLDTILGP